MRTQEAGLASPSQPALATCLPQPVVSRAQSPQAGLDDVMESCRRERLGGRPPMWVDAWRPGARSGRGAPELWWGGGHFLILGCPLCRPRGVEELGKGVIPEQATPTLSPAGPHFLSSQGLEAAECTTSFCGCHQFGPCVPPETEGEIPSVSRQQETSFPTSSRLTPLVPFP